MEYYIISDIIFMICIKNQNILKYLLFLWIKFKIKRDDKKRYTISYN